MDYERAWKLKSTIIDSHLLYFSSQKKSFGIRCCCFSFWNFKTDY